jgi:acetylglutamate kinase
MADMKEWIAKAETLQEALPYIRRFHGALFVIKYGGHAMTTPELRESFARDVALLKFVGIHPIIVHGGGPQIDAMLAKLGVTSTKIDGIRVTDPQTMDVVEMVLAGKINQEIVSLICKHGGRAVGLSGKDDGFLIAKKVERLKSKSGVEVDPGLVGDDVSVKADIVMKLSHGGFIPVIAPVAVDTQSRSLNVNADTVAGSVAAALEAQKLVLMTDIEGVRGRDDALIPSLDRNAAKKLIDDGVATGGMIPKLTCALDAIDRGVSKVHIVDGRVEHAVLLEIFTDRGVGTELVGAR